MKEPAVILRIAIVACFLLGAVAPTAAQPTENRAQELYDQGRALVAAGKTAEGCDAFEQSQQLEPLATTLIALATCRERLGRLATARKLFLQAEQQTRSASDRVTAQLHQLAGDKVAELESRVSKLTIHVPEQNRLDGLEIVRGSDRVDAAIWNRESPIDGGTYTITARAPGTPSWSVTVTVASESDFKTVEIPLLDKAPRDAGKSDGPSVVAAPAVHALPIISAPEVPSISPGTSDTSSGTPETSRVSENAALVIALGGTAVSYGLVVVGSQMNTHGDGGKLLWSGLLGTLIAPSAGRWYARTFGLRGLMIRLAGVGTAVVTLLVAVDDCDGCGSAAGALGVTAVGLWLGGTIDDIVMAPRDARQHNEHLRQVTLMPLVRPGDHVLGLAIGARF
jgi:hypothetical protein